MKAWIVALQNLEFWKMKYGIWKYGKRKQECGTLNVFLMRLGRGSARCAICMCGITLEIPYGEAQLGMPPPSLFLSIVS